MLLGKVACLGVAHLFHFLSCPGATALDGLKFIKSLFGLDSGHITQEAFNDCLYGRGGAVRIAKPGLLGEWISDFVVTAAHGIPEACINLLSETVLLVTGSCVVLDGRDVPVRVVTWCRDARSCCVMTQRGHTLRCNVTTCRQMAC